MWTWAERYGIGRKIGGDWHISRVALQMLLDGDTAALATYHAGNRTCPAVRAYFENAGCGALLQKITNSANRAKPIWRRVNLYPNPAERQPIPRHPSRPARSV